MGDAYSNLTIPTSCFFGRRLIDTSRFMFTINNGSTRMSFQQNRRQDDVTNSSYLMTSLCCIHYHLWPHLTHPHCESVISWLIQGKYNWLKPNRETLFYPISWEKNIFNKAGRLFKIDRKNQKKLINVTLPCKFGKCFTRPVFTNCNANIKKIIHKNVRTTSTM